MVFCFGASKPILENATRDNYKTLKVSDMTYVFQYLKINFDPPQIDLRLSSVFQIKTHA